MEMKTEYYLTWHRGSGAVASPAGNGWAVHDMSATAVGDAKDMHIAIVILWHREVEEA